MAWILTKLPEYTSWALLIALALYDLCAVLSPCGPLKALINLAQERQDPIPGLLYEANVGPERRGAIMYTTPSAPGGLAPKTALCLAVVYQMEQLPARRRRVTSPPCEICPALRSMLIVMEFTVWSRL